jgi:hypothetical protein
MQRSKLGYESRQNTGQRAQRRIFAQQKKDWPTKNAKQTKNGTQKSVLWRHGFEYRPRQVSLLVAPEPWLRRVLPGDPEFFRIC